MERGDGYYWTPLGTRRCRDHTLATAARQRYANALADAVRQTLAQKAEHDCVAQGHAACVCHIGRLRLALQGYELAMCQEG